MKLSQLARCTMTGNMNGSRTNYKWTNITWRSLANGPDKTPPIKKKESKNKNNAKNKNIILHNWWHVCSFVVNYHILSVWIAESLAWFEARCTSLPIYTFRSVLLPVNPVFPIHLYVWLQTDEHLCTTWPTYWILDEIHRHSYVLGLVSRIGIKKKSRT